MKRLPWSWWLLISLNAGIAAAEVTASKRHIIIVQPGVDTLYGSYLVAIENRETKQQAAQVPLMLPKEVVDFRPEEGLDKEDLQLVDSAQGSLQVNKTFPPGSSLIGVGFNVRTQAGATKLTFVAPYPIEEFLIMAPAGKVSMSAEGMDWMPNQDFIGQRYDVLQMRGSDAGRSFVVELTNLPQGRYYFWIVGSLLAVILILAGVLMTWLTLPILKEKGMILSEQ